MEIRERNRTLRVVLSVFGACLLAVTAFPLFAQDAQTQQAYLQNCAVCHGADGAGKTAKGKQVKAKDLRSAEVQKMTDAQLLDAILNGKGENMSGFEKELGKDTCMKLVAYVRELGKK